MDKTKFIYDLVNTETYYFLARPRRFGKSLLLTTLKALRDALIAENIPQFVEKFQSFLSDIPGRLHISREAYYHSLTYLMLRLVGAKALLEKETDKGRIDAVLELPDKVYIIEFKFATATRIKQVSTLSKRALKQIKDNKYYEPYLDGRRRVLLLGLGFLNKQLHGRVEEWKSI